MSGAMQGWGAVVDVGRDLGPDVGKAGEQEWMWVGTQVQMWPCIRD